jgi:hypothetical protein
VHLENLSRLRMLGPDRILPNHGDPSVIATGGYSQDLIAATELYIRALRRCQRDPDQRNIGLRDLIGVSLDAGFVHYFAPYEAVHRENLATVIAAA